MDIRQIESSLASLLTPRNTVKPRQLVFWYDDRAEFADTFEELTLPSGTDKIKLDDRPFTTKYRVLIEQPSTSFWNW